MTRNRLFAVVAGAIVGVVAFGAAAHASAGPVHEAAACLACSLCEWLNSALS